MTTTASTSPVLAELVQRYGDSRSVPGLLQARAERDPEGVLIEEVGGACVTNADFHARARQVADLLVHLRVRPGDRVATLLPTTPRGHEIWIGICWAGAMEVPINPEFKGNSLLHALNDSGATVLITSAVLLVSLSSIKPQLHSLERVLTVEAAPAGTEFPAQALDDLLADAPSFDHPEPAVTDPYAVIYTSGTTGPSKGVVVPWQSIQVSTGQLFAGDDIGDYDAPAFYCPWPGFHSSGKVGIVFAAVLGTRLVMRERLSISAYWDDIHRYRCTHTQLLGLAGMLMAAEERAGEADNPLQRVLMNPVLPDYRDFERRFGVVVSTGWGMTEIGFPLACSQPPDATTCGRLSTLYEVRLVNDRDEDVPEGEVGELVVRPHLEGLLLKGYLGRPEATARAWRNGWFHTGDALRRDAEGYYYFVDRVSDYIRVLGNNVSSLELEAEVLSHPMVAACAAVGVPARLCPKGEALRADLGEDEIQIIVQLEDGAALSAPALLSYLEPRVPRYMLPRFIRFASELPRTPTGKIRKKELRAEPHLEGAWDRSATPATVSLAPGLRTKD